MAKVEFLFLNRHDVEGLLPDMTTVVDLVEQGLAAHGRGDVVPPPKSHIHLDERYNGHFSVLPGYAGHIDRAGVKVVGDYVDDWKHGFPFRSRAAHSLRSRDWHAALFAGRHRRGRHRGRSYAPRVARDSRVRQPHQACRARGVSQGMRMHPTRRLRAFDVIACVNRAAPSALYRSSRRSSFCLPGPACGSRFPALY